jgi:hypothetical protein
MRKQWILLAINGLFLTLSQQALAHPEYIVPAGAISCSDCHNGDSRSKNFQTGILAAFPIDQTLSNADKVLAIQALRGTPPAISQTVKDVLAYINHNVLNPVALNPDTKPVLSTPSNTWDITVGEGTLNVPYSVVDAENDTFSILGTGMPASAITVDPVTQAQKFSLSWTPNAVHAGQSYPINVYVRENHRNIGRFLTSNFVPASIKVWPARANANTAQVGQFALYNAQWDSFSSTVTLSGQLAFKDGVTAEQQATSLSTLPLAVSSAKGKAVSAPAPLTADDMGMWTASVLVAPKKVPCSVIVNYEGLKAQRPVIGAPANCIK